MEEVTTLCRLTAVPTVYFTMCFGSASVSCGSGVQVECGSMGIRIQASLEQSFCDIKYEHIDI
jgi:hypothetical protein